MTRRRNPQRSAAWLGCAAALLLGLAAAFLAHIHQQQIEELRAHAAQTRARLMAQSIAQRLSHAASAGIPLHHLVGVAKLLAHWQAAHPEVTHIAVYDPQGQLLWRSRAPADLLSTESVSAGRADVVHAGRLQARVSLQLQTRSIDGAPRALALLAPAVLLVSALAFLAACFACSQGPWLRNHGLRMIGRWAVRGDYRQLLLLPRHQAFDLRVQEVAQAMRNAHERMAHTRLLIGSLRRTEPQQLQRDDLDQILRQTEADAQFPDTAPRMLRLVAVPFQALWMGMLLSLGAASPLAYALREVERSADLSDPWQQALPATSLGLLVLAAAVGWKLCARLPLTAHSALVLGHFALLLPPLSLLLGADLHPGWIAVWNGGFAGAALAACARAQTHAAQHPGFVHLPPDMPHAARLAWWGGLLWLAPAFGHYTQTAFAHPWALLALLLPIACGLFHASRWDVAHSPWRVPMAGTRAPRPADHGWRGRVLGIAAGLVAGAVMWDLAATHSPSVPDLLQQGALGLGTGLAMLWAGRHALRQQHRPAPAPSWFGWVLALATVTLQSANVLAEAFPTEPVWLDTIGALAHLSLGMLLGHGLAQAARSDTLPRRLLYSALGAALGAVAIALDLQVWVPVAAALLLTPFPGGRARGCDVH